QEERDGRSKPEVNSSGLRLDLIDEYIPGIFDALADLHGRQGKDREHWVHADLSPANIIVRPGPRGKPRRVVLVDLGRNYLYSRSIAGLGGSDIAFVAPEVRKDETSFPRADLYSLGKLIILVAGRTPEPTSIVPDVFYERVPALARFVEDLVD